MVKKSDSSEAKMVSCAICRKEVPLSEALIPEAADYVAYFCGLECYEKWKKQRNRQGQKSGNTKK